MVVNYVSKKEEGRYLNLKNGKFWMGLEGGSKIFGSKKMVIFPQILKGNIRG